MRSTGWLKKVLPSTWFFSVALSIFLAVSVYILFLQSVSLGKRQLAAALIVFLVLFIPVTLLIDQFLLPRFSRLAPRGKIILILSSVLFGLLIILTTNYSPLYYALPNHSLEIVVPPASGNSEAGRKIQVVWITTGLGDVSFSQLRQGGDWEISESGISYSGPQPASLEWEGKTGEFITVDFLSMFALNPISVILDGRESQLDLGSAGGSPTTFSSEFRGFNPGLFLSAFFLWVSSAFAFFSLTIFFLSWEIRSSAATTSGKYAWLLYALPMIAVWGIFLLTFFPGMMSTDSNDQWRQVITGQFNDAHPVFHTLFLWLITRLWLSPAAVVIAQILFLSLTAAWGIRILEEHGLPRWAAWLVSAVFAFAPLNANMVIILWKDIPYSTSLFLLSLMVLKVVLTRGEWLQKPLAWVWFGLASLAVTSFRHNGLPIPFATLLLLMVFYRRWWRPLIQTLALTLILYGIIHGPFYTSLNVEKNPSGFLQKIMLHHIAAHIETGQPLNASEQVLADTIFPREKWRYTSCSALSIEFQPGYSSFETPEQESAIRNLFIGLALKEPLVELRHLARVSSIVWRSPGECGANTLLPIDYRTWISILPNKYIQENSLAPILQKPLAEFLIMLRNDPGMTLFVAPAVYLWFGIYATAILAIRRKQWRILLYMLPVVIQAAIFIVINISDNFRYHYAAYLAGVFGLGLLILSLISTQKNPDGTACG